MATYPAQFTEQNGTVVTNGNVVFTDASNQPAIPNPIASGALPTQSFSSTVAAQISTTRGVMAYIVYTTSGAGGTCKLELSPDNQTYSTLVTDAPGVSGAVVMKTVFVPQSWYLKITVATASITSVTYA